MFPAPPRPEFPSDQHGKFEGHLRYEDVTQDGRLMPIAVPPALAGFWRNVLVKHKGATLAGQQGIIPILTRLTISARDEYVRVDRAIESDAGFQLAHDRDASGEVTRLVMNVWCDVRGAAGRIVPRTPAGPLTLAGQVFAEHIYTRPFGPPEQRKITRLAVPGLPEVPELRYAVPSPATAGEAPEGARWIDELAADPVDYVFTLDQTDSNQHVNSLVYIRIFGDAVNRRLASPAAAETARPAGHPAAAETARLAGRPAAAETARPAGRPAAAETNDRPLGGRTKAVDIAYRKPCFAGDRVRVSLRVFEHQGILGAAGFIAVQGEEAKPRCYVRVLLGP